MYDIVPGVSAQFYVEQAESDGRAAEEVCCQSAAALADSHTEQGACSLGPSGEVFSEKQKPFVGNYDISVEEKRIIGHECLSLVLISRRC